MTGCHDRIVIGTRGSGLALWQARQVEALLSKACPERPTTIKIVKTGGDVDQTTRLSDGDGKGFFTKELEDELLEGTVDICVHSMKDVAMQTPPGLEIAAMLERADARDALINFDGLTLGELAPGARVATGSLRRAAQIALLRPDIELCEIRGNVDTRVGKVRRGDFDAAILAVAGLERMGLADCISQRFSTSDLVPAAGQGAIGIEARIDDAAMHELLESICHRRTMEAVMAERRIMQTFDGSCKVPIGVYLCQEPEDGIWTVDAFISTPDASRFARVHLDGSMGGNDPDTLAEVAIEALRAQGAERIRCSA